jgi:DinB superfamily
MVATGAMLLARGILPEERLPSAEVPWETLPTLQAVQARLQESSRMCRALLDAWPDSPRLDITRTIIPAFGPINAIGLYAFGIAHSQQHVDQVRETIHQYNVSGTL